MLSQAFMTLRFTLPVICYQVQDSGSFHTMSDVPFGAIGRGRFMQPHIVIRIRAESSNVICCKVPYRHCLSLSHGHVLLRWKCKNPPSMPCTVKDISGSLWWRSGLVKKLQDKLSSLLCLGQRRNLPYPYPGRAGLESMFLQSK